MYTWQKAPWRYYKMLPTRTRCLFSARNTCTLPVYYPWIPGFVIAGVHFNRVCSFRQLTKLGSVSIVFLKLSGICSQTANVLSEIVSTRTVAGQAAAIQALFPHVEASSVCGRSGNVHPFVSVSIVLDVSEAHRHHVPRNRGLPSHTSTNLGCGLCCFSDNTIWPSQPASLCTCQLSPNVGQSLLMAH